MACWPIGRSLVSSPVLLAGLLGACFATASFAADAPTIAAPSTAEVKIAARPPLPPLPPFPPLPAAAQRSPSGIVSTDQPPSLAFSAVPADFPGKVERVKALALVTPKLNLEQPPLPLRPHVDTR